MPKPANSNMEHELNGKLINVTFYLEHKAKLGALTLFPTFVDSSSTQVDWIQCNKSMALHFNTNNTACKQNIYVILLLKCGVLDM